MAFSVQEKTKILFFLGYSVYEDDGPAMRSINSLDAREATAGDIVREILSQLDNIDQQILKTIPLSKAIEDGSIKLRSHYSLAHMRELGRQYVVRLARFLKISICGDVFSTGTDARNSDEFYSGDPSGLRRQGGGYGGGGGCGPY